MPTCARALPFAVLAAMFAGGACGGADSVGPPGPDRCDPIYCGSRPPTPVPDGPAACADGVCNYQTQEGCGDAETCAPGIDNQRGTVAPACRTAGTVAVGGTCDAARPCVRGAHCILDVAGADGGAPTGTCRKLCCGGDWTACDAGESCIRQINVRFVKPGDPSIDGKVVYADVDYCSTVGNCDVLDVDDCSEQGRACRIVNPVTVACTPRGSLDVGEDCADSNQCGAGMHCVARYGAENAIVIPPRCRKFCPFGPCVESGCADNEKCVHFPNDPPGVGECTPDWDKPPAALDAGSCR